MNNNFTAGIFHEVSFQANIHDNNLTGNGQGYLAFPDVILPRAAFLPVFPHP